MFISNGRKESGEKWFQEGMLKEEDGLFFNGFVSGFLERQNGKFLVPEQPVQRDSQYNKCTAAEGLS